MVPCAVDPGAQPTVPTRTLRHSRIEVAAMVSTDVSIPDSPATAQPPADGHRFRYQPFFCEENAWWLCAEPALGDGPRAVLFVSSARGACPLAAQRAVPPGMLCWWDYHVVVLDALARIWDLDTRLGLPVSAADWLHQTFPSIERLPADLMPWFRLVPAAAYRAQFASDRSHMRTAGGGWCQPPPAWPPIGAGMNLAHYQSLAPNGPGEILSWRELLARVSAERGASPQP